MDVLNYLIMFIMTDYYFYKVIFKMREIKIMQFSEIKTFSEFRVKVNCQKKFIYCIYCMLAILNALQILWIFKLDLGIIKYCNLESNDECDLKSFIYKHYSDKIEWVSFFMTNIVSYGVHLYMTI